MRKQELEQRMDGLEEMVTAANEGLQRLGWSEMQGLVEKMEPIRRQSWTAFSASEISSINRALDGVEAEYRRLVDAFHTEWPEEAHLIEWGIEVA